MSTASDNAEALALILAREWQQTIAALALDTVECLQIVKEVELKPELEGHPYYWGKMALLRTLRPLADADVKRFETEGACRLLREMEYAHHVLSVSETLASWYRDMLRYVPPDEYDDALARLQAYDAIVKGFRS